MWSIAQIENERQKLRNWVEEKSKTTSHLEILQELKKTAAETKLHDGEEALLKLFTSLELCLSIHADSNGLKDSEAKNFFKTLLLILKRLDIKPYISRLAFLYTDLYNLLSKIEGQQGHTFLSGWWIELGRHLTYKTPDTKLSTEASTAAEIYLAQGHGSLALVQCNLAEQDPKNEESYFRARLLRAKINRLIGQPTEATVLLNEIEENLPKEKKERLLDEITWERTYLDIARNPTPSKFFPVLRKNELPIYRILELKLWAYCSSSRSLPNHFPKSESLRKRKNFHLEELNRFRYLYEVIGLLEKCYDDDHTLHSRIEELGKSLADRNKLNNSEHELVFLFASARFLLRYTQLSLAEYVLSEYRALCLKLSSGTTQDTLGLSATLIEDSKTAENKLLAEVSPHKSAPKSRSARWLAVGKIAAQSAGILVSHRIRQIIASKEEQQKIIDARNLKLGEVMYQRLTPLKGILMKFGQVFGNNTELPESFRFPLTFLFDAAEPSDPKYSIKVFEEEIGKKIDDVFEQWNPEPVAVGSLGQLFRARHKDGRNLIVKIQHPEMSETATNDISNLYLLVPYFKSLLPSSNIRAIFKEIERRFHEELDYTKEAKNQEEFREKFQSHPDIVIPKVDRTLTTKRVLTQEYINGRNFNEFKKNASQEERNQACTTILKMLVSSMYKYHLFNGDPNPGNYLFLEDGKVAFLDFGYVKRWEPDYSNLQLTAFKTALEQDLEAFSECWKSLKLVGVEKKYDFQAQLLTHKIYLKPLFIEGKFRFDKRFFEQLKLIHTTHNPNIKYFSAQPDNAILIRLIWGIASILSDLRPELNFRELGCTALYGNDRNKWPKPESEEYFDKLLPTLAA